MEEPKEINGNYLLLIIILPILSLFLSESQINTLSLFLQQFSTTPSVIGVSTITIILLITATIYILKVKNNEKKNIRHFKNVEINEKFIIFFGIVFSFITGPLFAIIMLHE